MTLTDLKRNAIMQEMFELSEDVKADHRPYIFLNNGLMVRSYKETRRKTYVVISFDEMLSLPIETLKEHLKWGRLSLGLGIQ